MAKKPAMNSAWTEWYPAGTEPARATIGVETMGVLRLVEVCVVAAVSEGGGGAAKL